MGKGIVLKTGGPVWLASSELFPDSSSLFLALDPERYKGRLAFAQTSGDLFEAYRSDGEEWVLVTGEEEPVGPILTLSGLYVTEHSHNGGTTLYVRYGEGEIIYEGSSETIPRALVGAGGAGAIDAVRERGAAGGAGGGVLFNETFTLNPGAYPVVVGKGGFRARQDLLGRGEDTTWDSDTALGGGRGVGRLGTEVERLIGTDGGSGGGALSIGNLGEQLGPGSGTPGQGFDGGTATNGAGGSERPGAGGGGAGGAGGDTPSSRDGGDGGIGIDLSQWFGSAVGDDGYFGGGAGGNARNSGGLGGKGGANDTVASGTSDADAITPASPNWPNNAQMSTGGATGAVHTPSDYEGISPVAGSGAILVWVPSEVEIINDGPDGILNLRNTAANVYEFEGDNCVEIQASETGLIDYAGPTINAHIALAAQGGAGGNSNFYNGAGGAGELYYDTNYSLSEGSYAVVIGNKEQDPQDNGADSQFGSIITKGGGGGGREGGGNVAGPGQDGGSGGGGSTNSASRRVGGQSTATIGLGHPGGAGGESSGDDRCGGGGGGAGGPGQDGGAVNGGQEARGGDGGPGVDVSASFGTSVGDNGWLCGGGGGASRAPADGLPGQGGPGGGGNGSGQNMDPAQPGMPNTGGGGGGGQPGSGNTENEDVRGGSGVLLIRVPSNVKIIKAAP